MKSSFHKVIASVRSALEMPTAPALHEPAGAASFPATPAARRAELVSQFAHELERVNGHFLGVMRPAELAIKARSLVKELGARSIAVGEGVTVNSAPVVEVLSKSGLETITPSECDDEQRRLLRARLAECDLAVVEAHYAIAATGTLVMVATPGRPSSLTLLPPANLIVVNAARVLPDMAAVLGALGPESITRHRIAFITGPSRTADIEKMIVLGVHGPKYLYAAVVWNNEQAAAAEPRE